MVSGESFDTVWKIIVSEGRAGETLDEILNGLRFVPGNDQLESDVFQ